MSTPHPDSFKSKSTLKSGSKTVNIFRLQAVADGGVNLKRLPFSLRILLENLLRHEDGRTVTAEDIKFLANWDPKAFQEPERLFLHRTKAGQNVAFGYGRHQCVGQQLARAELQIVFTTLFRRIPTLRLAIPIEEVPLKHDRLAYGVYELPVTW